MLFKKWKKHRKIIREKSILLSPQYSFIYKEKNRVFEFHQWMCGKKAGKESIIFLEKFSIKSAELHNIISFQVQEKGKTRSLKFAMRRQQEKRIQNT